MPSAVILTRPAGENTALAATLRSQGHDVLELPCVATAPLEDDSSLIAALRALGARDGLIVTSRAGAAAVVRTGVRVAAPVATVGVGAAVALRASGMSVERTAPTGRELAALLTIPGGHVLLARSDRALADLPALLIARGARVREVIAYRTIARVDGDAERAGVLASGGAAIVVASPSAFDALVERLGTGVVSRGRVIATGPTTAAHVRARLGRPAVIAPWRRVAELV